MSIRDAINRANSRYSTGPKTEAGKQRSSQNALRHGLTAQSVVMPNESLADYRAHLKSFVDEYQPQGATETQLVQTLADTSWRHNRVAFLEARLLTLTITPPREPSKWPSEEARRAGAVAVMLVDQSKALANLSLHSQRLSREFERTVAQLRKLQETRRAQEQKDLDKLDKKDGFVFTEPQITRARLAPKAMEPRPAGAVSGASPVQSIDGRHR